MLIMMAVFALVIAVVWFIRKFAFDYSFEISIGAGVMVNILGFLIADLQYDATVSVGTLIAMSVLSGLIAMLCDYMKRVLDYTAVERVQFEDDDYYYYVKAVPKVNISLREMDIKHFNRSAVDGEDYEYEEEIEDETPYIKVEKMPSFMGGDLNAFRKWVQERIKYPQIAQENGITGRVVLSFVVEKDGSVTNIQVLQSPDRSLGEEASRVLATSPKWEPGQQSSQKVRVKYTLPVMFQIN